MPIRPELKRLYPPNWPQLSKRIRFERARGRCECTGQCGAQHAGRCGAVNHERTPAGSLVVLTVAHVDHDQTNNDEANLLALCQACHLRLDVDQHKASRRANKRRQQSEAGQKELFK